ncbi:hypothetical protein [uncultured Desulfuromusa sp.]|uniref:hypothetical protein n=1 Tax=uncultured Desulfuromusa sp. TaxID=219183 RepID=UPI002AA5ED92|nr:hypothetical protein [uncultured Desulfuromusa sp.]
MSDKKKSSFIKPFTGVVSGEWLFYFTGYWKSKSFNKGIFPYLFLNIGNQLILALSGKISSY